MFVDTKETAFFYDLSKPSLQALSHILRHKELWPKDFNWDYGNCESCAMGLAARLWKLSDTIRITDCEITMSKDFGITVEQAYNIFIDLVVTKPEITPEMVADEIDKICLN